MVEWFHLILRVFEEQITTRKRANLILNVDGCIAVSHPLLEKIELELGFPV